MTICPGGIVDFDAIAARIKEVHEAYSVEWIAADNFKISELINALKRIGITLTRFPAQYAHDIKLMVYRDKRITPYVMYPGQDADQAPQFSMDQSLTLVEEELKKPEAVIIQKNPLMTRAIHAYEVGVEVHQGLYKRFPDRTNRSKNTVTDPVCALIVGAGTALTMRNYHETTKLAPIETLMPRLVD